MARRVEHYVFNPIHYLGIVIGNENIIIILLTVIFMTLKGTKQNRKTLTLLQTSPLEHHNLKSLPSNICTVNLAFSIVNFD